MFTNFDSALIHAQLAEKELGPSKSVVRRADVFNHLGNIYKYMSQHAISMKYYLRSKTIIEDALKLHKNDILIM